MKKLLMSLMAVVLCLSMVGCSSKEESAKTEETKEEVQKELYAGFYRTIFPEGYETTSTQMQWTDTNDEHKLRKISIEASSQDLETKIRYGLEMHDDGVQGEDVTIGQYTYKTIEYTADDIPCKLLLMEMPGVEDRCIKVDLYRMTEEDEDAKMVLENLEIEDDAYTKVSEFLKSLNED